MCETVTKIEGSKGNKNLFKRSFKKVFLEKCFELGVLSVSWS